MCLSGRWQAELALIDEHMLIALQGIPEFCDFAVNLEASFAYPALDLATRAMSRRRQDFLDTLSQCTGQPAESAGSGQSETTRSSSALISGCSVGNSSASAASLITAFV